MREHTKTEMLKRFIKSSSAVQTVEVRQFLLWLIDKTEDLTKDVGVKFGYGSDGFGKDVANCVHLMTSTLSGFANINKYIKEHHINISFSSGCAIDYDGWVVWISKQPYEPKAHFFNFDEDAIRQIPI